MAKKENHEGEKSEEKETKVRIPRKEERGEKRGKARENPASAMPEGREIGYGGGEWK